MTMPDYNAAMTLIAPYVLTLGHVAFRSPVQTVVGPRPLDARPCRREAASPSSVAAPAGAGLHGRERRERRTEHPLDGGELALWQA
jgi:hypothetical protein